MTKKQTLYCIIITIVLSNLIVIILFLPIAQCELEISTCYVTYYAHIMQYIII